MPRYECPECNHRWRGRGRKPGGEVHCPSCGKRAYTYAKAVRPMTPKGRDEAMHGGKLGIISSIGQAHDAQGEGGGRPAMSWRRKEVGPSERP